jgi:phosphodiesterase/alkaline phosphatase D-like protein
MTAPNYRAYRAYRACAIAVAFVVAASAASAVTACGRSDKEDKQASAEAKKKKKKKKKPKTKMPVLTANCAAPVEAHTYELPRVANAADLRAPATEGTTQLAAGPMLGAVADQSVKLWLRMDRPTAWRTTIWPIKAASSSVATAAKPAVLKPGKGKRVIEGALPAQEHDFISVLDIGELTPATTYAYQVEIGTDKEAIKLPPKTFRTLAAVGTPTKIRFAVGGHIAGDIDGKIFTQIAETNPDFLVLLGDQIYSEGIKANFPAFADKYTRNWSIPELKELLHSVPAFMIWDDQEIKKGYYAGSSTSRLQPARLAYELYAQSHNPTPALPGALHYQFRAGDVSFFVVDGRSHRSNPKDEPGPKKTMVGKAQKAELARFLKCDSGKIKVIVSPVMFGGPARGNQAWTAFKAERDQLLSFIEAEKVDNVIVLSGDQQWSAVLKHDRPKTSIYELLATPLSKGLGEAPTEASKDILARDDDQHVFGVVDIDTTVTPATIAFTLCGRGKPCKPGEEPAPTTGMDVEGEQENVPLTVKITDADLGLKTEPTAEAAPTPAPAVAAEAATETVKEDAPAKDPSAKPAPAAETEAAKTPAPK